MRPRRTFCIAHDVDARRSCRSRAGSVFVVVTPSVWPSSAADRSFGDDVAKTARLLARSRTTTRVVRQFTVENKQQSRTMRKSAPWAGLLAAVTELRLRYNYADAVRAIDCLYMQL